MALYRNKKGSVGPINATPTGVTSTVSIDIPDATITVTRPEPKYVTGSLKSTDGTVWTTYTATSGLGTNPVYLNGLFYGIMGAYTSVTSTDGLVWTPSTMSLSYPITSQLTYFNSSFHGTNNSRYIKSTDGITWTYTLLPSVGVSASWSKVVQAPNGNLVAVLPGTYEGPPATQYATYSTNGVTWTLRTTATVGYWVDLVAGSNGVFAATGGPEMPNATFSTDGVTWAARTLPYNMNYGYRGVVYGNSTWLACSQGYEYATSTDALTWTPRTWPAVQRGSQPSFTNGVFMAANTNVMSTSTNGITWTIKTLPASGFAARVVWGNPTTTRKRSLREELESISPSIFK